MIYVDLIQLVFALHAKIIFCDTCFKYVHDKKTKPHEKEQIDLFVPIDIKCPEHPLVPLNLFCTDEKGNLL